MLFRSWGKVISLLIRAPSDKEFDRIVDEFNQYKKEKGIDKVVAAQTKLMNANKAKLGMR